ncbi:MAG: DUF2845 domain-containing protein [Dokdonella sp.]
MKQILLLLVLMMVLASSSAFAMRCGNLLVDAGAQDFQVRERCGDPFWTDRYTSVDVIGAYGPLEEQRSVQFDVWYYNFGPRQLMRQMIFRDGVLLREETLGYGVDDIGSDCNPNRDYAGFSVGELYARCGEPASRRSETDTIVRRPAPGVERWRDQRRESWVYDFGDDRFVRIVRLVNGRVDGTDLVHR